jgi:hypothetical protein
VRGRPTNPIAQQAGIANEESPMLKNDEKREKQQLIDGAELYLEMAKNIQTEDEDNEKISKYRACGKEHRIFQKLAHLSSAAIRICTLCEIQYPSKGIPNPYKLSKNGAPYNWKKERQKGSVGDVIKEVMKIPHQYIAYLLRDNISHKEKDRSTDYYADKNLILMEYSLRLIVEGLENTLKELAVGNPNNCVADASENLSRNASS